MTTTHFTAWLTTVDSCLDQPCADVTVLEDELIGDPADGDKAWASAGKEPVFYAVTDVPADGTKDPGPAAEELLRDAGWALAGKWTPVSTGAVVTVERES